MPLGRSKTRLTLNPEQREELEAVVSSRARIGDERTARLIR